MSLFGFGNKKLEQLKSAFDVASIPRKDSLLYTHCKEIIEDPGYKALSGPHKDLCIFDFSSGQSSFAIGASSRGVVTQSCIVIAGKMQIGYNHVDIKINCTQKYPTDAPQVYFSLSGSNSFHMFPFATLPPPSGSQHWNFCAGTTLLQMLRAMGQYKGALPYSAPAAAPAPPPATPPPVIAPPPPQFNYKQQEILQTQIGHTFDEKSPMQKWMDNPNSTRQPPPHQAYQAQAGWPVFPINPAAPSPQQEQYGQPPARNWPPPASDIYGQSAQPGQHFESDTVPTPPIISMRFPVAPSHTPGPPPPRPIVTPPNPAPVPHQSAARIYEMGFGFEDVQLALQEAQQDEVAAINILIQRQERLVPPPVVSGQPFLPPPPVPMPSFRHPESAASSNYIPPPPFPPPNYDTGIFYPPPPPAKYPPGAYPAPSGHPSDFKHASAAAPHHVSPGPIVGPPPKVLPPFPPAPTDIGEFTIVVTVDNCDFPMCVRAANSTAILDGIKSELGEIAMPELRMEGENGVRWVPLSAVRYEDLPRSMQIRVPPAAPVAPPPEYNKNFNAPPAGFQQAQPQSLSPPAPPVDDIAAHGSYPIVKSAEIEFDLDSQGNRIELGRGVFKAVYRGRFFGTPVAINMLLEESASESDKQEFLRECNVLSNLRHGNIIGLLGACTDSKKCFLLTELMHNGTLFSVLHERRVQLTTKQRQDIVLGMLMGMNNMHMRRVYHRDLKSANILIDAHFTPKIADFGFAKQKSAAKAKELFQSKVGTPLWMAPEVLLGQEYDPEKADVWSVGMLVFETLAGKVPYATPGLQATTEAQLCQMIQQNRRPPLDGINPQVAAILQRCWNINPALRPTVCQMLQEYQRTIQQ